jgi:hypothetical protein
MVSLHVIIRYTQLISGLPKDTEILLRIDISLTGTNIFPKMYFVDKIVPLDYSRTSIRLNEILVSRIYLSS